MTVLLLSHAEGDARAGLYPVEEAGGPGEPRTHLHLAPEGGPEAGDSNLHEGSVLHQVERTSCTMLDSLEY